MNSMRLVDADGPVLPSPATTERIDPGAWAVGPEFDVRLDGEILRVDQVHVGGRPCTTDGMVRSMLGLGERLRTLSGLFDGAEPPFRYYVMGARPSEAFNLGGDLALFRECVLAGDRERLLRYARGCADVIHWHHRRYNLPILTFAVIQGPALGGGLEFAMSFDFLVAEESAEFALPETTFNMFPGMGAYSFLSRRLGTARAVDMILGGRTYSARQMYDLGLVHHVVPDGTAFEALPRILAKVGRRFEATRTVMDLERRVNPVTQDELRAVVESWVDVAFALDKTDIRMMHKIVSRQQRRFTEAEATAEA